MFRVTEPETAEVAFAVSDALQGHGLGTLLLGQLAEIAASEGVRTFQADILPHNQQMLEMLTTSGFVVETHPERDEVIARFSTSLTEATLASYDLRDQRAAAAAIGHLLAPRSVAVIGASRRRGTVGGEVFHNLISGEFAGPVYPVNQNAASVQSVAAYTTLEQIPGSVDLAVIAAPGSQVEEIVAQCARKGVRGVVVLSAGFAEAGVEGRERQARLLTVLRDYGIRMIGPNCLGIVNTDPAVRLHATFGPTAPPSGRLGFMSQSGALGLAATEYARSLGLGISSFVSVGNKADVSGNDLLCYWETDPRTDVILLYLESFGNPRKFSRIARRVGQLKPIIAVKSGRSRAGARAAGSHTGALVSASETTIDALFHQSGVIRVDTIEEQFGVASLLASQPLPPGRRVAIITNVGGPGILCADACEANGLELPMLAEDTQRALREVLLPYAATANPVDLIASATAEQYAAALSIVARDPAVDAMITIFVQPLATTAEAVVQAIVGAMTQMPGGKPVLAVFMPQADVATGDLAGTRRVPTYAFPESAAFALAQAVRYAEWRRRPRVSGPPLEGRRSKEAEAIVSAALARGPGWLPPEEWTRLLDCYGIRCVTEQRASSSADAGRLAADMTGPFALKGVATEALHKTELGLVKLKLTSPRDVAEAAEAMASQARTRGLTLEGFLVQPMLTGVEMFAGMVHDPVFGPVVACGAGGVLVEVMRDVAVGLTPLSQRDASDMVQRLRSATLLAGFRGSPPADRPAFEDVLVRLSALAEDLPQVRELDCNPVMVMERGAMAVDVRVRVDQPPARLLLGGRS
jgi:acetyl coenzyme A synthetase (ADP forming)-like protein